MTERSETEQGELRATGGRVVRYYDTGDTGDTGGARTVFWHHGTPQSGRILEPVAAPAAERGFRVVSVTRPGYEGSTELPGRSVADAAADVVAVADALGIERFAVAGASGGGPHALAAAGLAPDRVTAVVALAGIAPYTDEFDWFAGMASDAALRAARLGRAARVRHAETAEFDESSFIAADRRALAGTWAQLGDDAGAAGAASPGAVIDDDLAFVHPWGVDLRRVRAPVLLVQGVPDRVVPAAHARWLATQLAHSELRLRPDDGHISVLEAWPEALDWIIDAG